MNTRALTICIAGLLAVTACSGSSASPRSEPLASTPPHVAAQAAGTPTPTSAPMRRTSVALSINAATVTVGSPAAANVRLSDTTPDASGTVSYTMYNDATCAGLPAVPAGVKPVVRGSAAGSDSVTFASAGTVFWQAAYSGDAANAPAKSTCTSLVVAKAKPTAWVALPDKNFFAKAATQATAGLGGATASAGGAFAYATYSDAACSRQLADAGSAVVRGNDVEPSAPFRVEAPGNYYLQGTYSGDANNEFAKSPCVGMVAAAAPTAPPALLVGAGTARPPAGATAICRDGTYSFSQTRSGTCSWHGGVATWLY